MRPRFRLVPDGVEVDLEMAEARLLGDLGRLLAGLGSPQVDPGAERLSLPAYPDDPEADAEWVKFAGAELEAARRADRAILADVAESLESDRPRLVSIDEAEALLRVVNDARLVLGARWGIEDPGDYEELREEAAWVMSFLGWVVAEIADVLGEALELP